jgi:hypothetical protein
LPGKAHGDLIWARKLTGAAVAPGAASTKVVLYRSQGVDGKATAVSGIVALPKGKAPKGGWPVITYAHGMTGLARGLRAFHEHAPSLPTTFDARASPATLFTDQLVKDLNKNGAKGLTYKKYPGVDHGAITTAAAKDATAWIAQRLR